MTNACPVCLKPVSGDAAALQRHVNVHLDATEEEKSQRAAEELNRSVNHPTSLSDKPLPQLTPAEKILRELEDNDAALASALAAAEGAGVNSAAPSLRGSLSDSAEHFYPDIMSKVFAVNSVSVITQGTHYCSKLDLFSSNIAGLGWDCGFRNIQMMCSSLLNDKVSREFLNKEGMTEVPSVPEIAGRIEEAWRKGFDPEGASMFQGTLIDKEVWIGATEVFILLRNMNIPAFVRDFEVPNSVFRQKMFEWIFDHFERWCRHNKCPAHHTRFLSSKSNCFIPPLFCQYPGHSLTITGAEKSRNGDIVLFVLDPDRRFYQSMTERRSFRPALARRHLHHPQFASPRFQLVSISPPEGSRVMATLRRGRGFFRGIRSD